MKQLAINQGKTDRRTPSNGSDAAKAVVRRNTDEVQGKGRFDVFEELFDDAFVDHTPQPNMTPDKAGVRKLYSYIREAFPDFHAEIHWQLADGDRVTTYKTYYGTHEGPLLGVAPTYRKIHFESVDVMRVRDGKIVEHWGVGNLLSLMQQIGGWVLPTEATSDESTKTPATIEFADLSDGRAVRSRNLQKEPHEYSRERLA
jgi:predicted ester cyclase